MNKARIKKVIAGLTIPGAYPRRDCLYVGEAIGSELISNRIWELQDIRAEIARLEDSKVSDFTVGYKTALLDILAAYQVALESKVRDMIMDTSSEDYWLSEDVIEPEPTT